MMFETNLQLKKSVKQRKNVQKVPLKISIPPKAVGKSLAECLHSESRLLAKAKSCTLAFIIIHLQSTY